MKKMLKISFTVVLLFCILISAFQVISDATSFSSTMGQLASDKDGWMKDTTGTDTKVNTITGTIIASIRVVGICVAIVMLLVVAMKYMTAAPGEKADIKKSAIQYVVGAIVLFGVVGILTILEGFSQNIKVS